MKPFPGTITKHGGANGLKIQLDDAQKAWLIKWFPITENARIAKAMGVSQGTVRKLAKECGVPGKSQAGIKAIQRRQTKAMVKTFNKLGLYDAKRGHPPSEATMEGNRRRWQEVKEGKRESPLAMLKRTSPERYQARLNHLSKTRKDIIHKEQLRLKYGLSRKTKLTMIKMQPYTRSQLHHRCNALRRGYLLSADISENSPDRYTIFYDRETKRSEIFEANCIADGFRIMKDY